MSEALPSGQSAPEDLKALAKADGRGLKRRLVRGFLSSLLGFAVMVASRFLLVPLFIGAWGIELYADWLMLQAVGMLLQCVFLGQQWRFSKEIRDAWSIRDTVGMNRVLADANGFSVLLVLGVGLALAVLASLVDITRVLNLEAMGRLEASLVLVLLTWSALALICQDNLRALYQSRGEFARAQLFATRNLALQTACVAVLLFLEVGVVAIAVVHCATFLLLAPTVLVIDSRRRFPEFRHRLRLRWDGLPSRRDLHDFGLPHLAETVSVGGPMFLLGLANVPSQQIVQFGLARTIGQTLRMLVRPFSIMFTIELVRQRTQGDLGRMHQLFRFAVIALAAIVGGIVGGLLGGVDLLYRVWTQGQVVADPTIFALVLAYAVAANLGHLPSHVLRLGGFAGSLLPPALANAVGYGAIGGVAVLLFGAPGLAAAIATLQLVFGYLIPARLADARLQLSARVSVGLATLIATLVGVVAYGAVGLLRAQLGF